MNSKLKIGDILYRPIFDKKTNAFLCIEAYKVDSIGRKYFTTKELCDRKKFEIETLKYIDKDYNHNNIQLYKSIKEIELEEEKKKLKKEIDSFFFDYKSRILSLKQLLEIKKIINE
jgi:alpha-galactosidase/6-phospho-beta-glucosidase family protein